MARESAKVAPKLKNLNGGGGAVQPTFLGKSVYQKAPPIGGSFGEVSESLQLLRSARRPVNGRHLGPGAQFNHAPAHINYAPRTMGSQTRFRAEPCLRAHCACTGKNSKKIYLT